MKTRLKVKLHPDCKDIAPPSYGHEGDAALDLRSRIEATIDPGKKEIIPTGIYVQIPEGYAGLIWDKGGLGQVHGLKTLGGVVDATYRGEIMVALVNVGEKPYSFQRGDKVAQMLIQKFESVDVTLVDELDDTERGDSRWGSTGT